MLGLQSQKALKRARLLTEGYEHSSSTTTQHHLSDDAKGFISSLYEAAGYSPFEAKQSRTRLVLSLLTTLVFVSLSGFIQLLVIVPLLPGLWFLFLQRSVGKRVDSFEKDYTALLLSLSAAVKTGLDPLMALSNSSDLFTEGSEVRKQLELFSLKLGGGATEEDALQSFARSIKHPDITLFRTALILARREGSSLSHCLQRLARVTRQRQSFRRRARSAVAMHKLSAIGIMISALIVLFIQFIGNPNALYKTLSHPVGSKIALMGGLLMFFGFTWMVLLARRRV